MAESKRSNGIIISYLYTAVTMVCGLFISSFLIRLLGNTEYGLYQTVSSFANYLVLLEFGTGTVMSRNVLLARNSGSQERLKKSISTVWYISLILSVLILAVAAVFYINIGRIYANSMTPEQVAYGKQIFLIVVVNLLASFLMQSLNGLLLGMEQYTFAKAIGIVKILLKVVVLIAVVSFERNAIAVSLIDSLLTVLVFVYTYIYCKSKYKVKFEIRAFDKGIFKDSLPLCLALFLQTVINQANSNVDKFVLGIMLNVEIVTVYSVAQYIYSMFSSIMTVPLSMYMPQVSKNIAKGLTGREMTKTLISPCRLAALLGGEIMFGFFAVGRQFIALLYGNDKMPAWSCALLIIVPTFVNMTNAVVINILDITNKRLVRSLALTGTTILNIILTVCFIPFWGMAGAAVATAISLIIGNIVIMNIYYQKKLDLKILYLFYQAYKGIIPFQLVAAVITFFAAKLIPGALASFAGGTMIFAAISGVLIYFFGLNEGEKKKVVGFLAKFGIKKR